jgi:hypothetical protein
MTASWLRMTTTRGSPLTTTLGKLSLLIGPVTPSYAVYHAYICRCSGVNHSKIPPIQHCFTLPCHKWWSSFGLCCLNCFRVPPFSHLPLCLVYIRHLPTNFLKVIGFYLNS